MPKKEQEEQMVKDIRAAIEASGLNFMDIERLTGIDHAAISRFVHGQRTLTLPVAARLCDLLGLRLRRVGKRRRPKE